MGLTSRFYTVYPVADIGEFDAPGWLGKAMPDAVERTNWVKRITSVTQQREIRLNRFHPELSIPWDSPPPFVLLHVPINLTGKMPDWRAHLEENVIPAYKEAGINVMVSRTALGGNGRQWSIARGFEKWAEIGDEIVGAGPVGEKLGQAAGGYLASQERFVLALRPDLSFDNR